MRTSAWIHTGLKIIKVDPYSLHGLFTSQGFDMTWTQI